jgi:4-amino-4-deoxy-L-arabinose transferase-like glycosyltransferase
MTAPRPLDKRMDSPEVQGRGVLERALGSRALLAGILILAATLRLTHVLALRPLPLFDLLVIDSAVYDQWAQRIAAGDWLGAGVFYQDPLYPYFLAFLYRVLGHDLLVVRLVQVALGVGTCALAAVIARRAAGPVAGNLAALLLALFKPSIFQEAEIDKTALGVFLLTAALALALDPRVRARAAAGALLGLAALTRGNLLLVAPLAAAVFAFHGSPGAAAQGTAQARLRDWLSRPSTRGAGAFLAAFALVLAPVTLRNHHLSGEWIPTTYGAGAVFYTGNNPANASGGFEHVPFVRSDAAYEEHDFRAAAEARAGRALSPNEISAFWFREGVRHVLERPAFAATVALRKVALFLSDYEVPDAWDLYFLARYSPVLALPLLSMAWLVGLAALGIGLAWRRSEVVRLLTGFTAVYALAVVAFFVFSRYRLYVVPALAVLGAIGIVSVWERWRSGELRSALPAAVAGLSLAAFSISGIGTPPKGEHLYSFVTLSNLYQARGDAPSAKRLLLEALGRDPDAAEVLCGLGRMQLEERDAAGGAELLRRCVTADPAFPGGWYWVGVAEFRVGNRAAAEQAFLRQLAIVPGHAESITWLQLMGR